MRMPRLHLPGSLDRSKVNRRVRLSSNVWLIKNEISFAIVRLTYRGLMHAVPVYATSVPDSTFTKVLENVPRVVLTPTKPPAGILCT